MATLNRRTTLGPLTMSTLNSRNGTQGRISNAADLKPAARMSLGGAMGGSIPSGRRSSIGPAAVG